MQPCALESHRQLLLGKIRQSLNTRGLRGFIGLKQLFKKLDVEQDGLLSLNQILQAFDDLKITNMQSDEVKMLFQIYDAQKTGSIDYHRFLMDLVT